MRRFWPSSLSWKLLLAILPLILLGVSAIVWLQYNMARKEMLLAINKEMELLTQRTAGNIDDLLQQRYAELFTLAETPLITDYYHNVEFQLLNEAATYRKELEKYLLNFSKRSRAYAEILYLNESGLEICRIRGGVTVKRSPVPSQEPYFLEIRSLPVGQWWTSPVQEMPGIGPILFYAKPVHNELKKFKGVLVLAYDLEQLISMLNNIKIGKTGRARIETDRGYVLKARARTPTQGQTLRTERHLNQQPWKVVAEAPLEDFLGPLKHVRNTVNSRGKCNGD